LLVIISHQFVVGAKSCESEEISVGGIEQVGSEVYKDFDYVALGHIHTPQTIKSEYIRYCGTPLKYSFSEANQEKSVTIIDFYEKGNIDIKLVNLKARIDMREIKGSYEEVTHLASNTDTRKINDYVSIKLTDEEDIIDGIYKLRGFYPNIMLLSYDNLRSKVKQDIKVLEDIEKKSEIEVFEELYEIQNNKKLSDSQKDFLNDLIKDLSKEDK